MKLDTESMNVVVTFEEPILGTLPGNKELVEKYIAARAPTPEAAKEEVESIEEETEKMTTVFARDESGLFLWDYHWKGYIKENLGSLAELGASNGISIYSCGRAVDRFVFVAPRRVRLLRPDGSPIMEPDEYCERSLRAKTMRGERICLARSQQLNPGTQCHLTITWLKSDNAKAKLAVFDRGLIAGILDMGARSGFGQWRSGSKGIFRWEERK